MNKETKQWVIRIRVSQREHIMVTGFARTLNLTTSDFLRAAAYIAMNAAKNRLTWEILKHQALDKLAGDE